MTVEISLVIGNSFDAEFVLKEYGGPLHNVRFRAFYRPDPVRQDTDTQQFMGYAVGGCHRIPLSIVERMNRAVVQLWQRAIAFDPSYLEYEPAPALLHGVAYFDNTSKTWVYENL